MSELAFCGSINSDQQQCLDELVLEAASCPFLGQSGAHFNDLYQSLICADLFDYESFGDAATKANKLIGKNLRGIPDMTTLMDERIALLKELQAGLVEKLSASIDANTSEKVYELIKQALRGEVLIAKLHVYRGLIASYPSGASEQSTLTRSAHHFVGSIGVFERQLSVDACRSGFELDHLYRELLYRSKGICAGEGEAVLENNGIIDFFGSHAFWCGGDYDAPLYSLLGRLSSARGEGSFYDKILAENSLDLASATLYSGLQNLLMCNGIDRWPR